MQLRHLGEVETHLAHSPVFADSLWEREAGQVYKIDLTMFHARMTSHGLGKEALGALEILQGEAITAMVKGQLREAPFITFEIQPPRFAVDELLQGLARLSPVRRQAALLALESGVSPDAVSMLTWPDVLRSNPPTAIAAEILRVRNRLRHIKLPYVFWEDVGSSINAPLLNLRLDIEGAFMQPWSLLSAGYANILMLHQRAEVDSFKEAMGGLQ